MSSWPRSISSWTGSGSARPAVTTPPHHPHFPAAAHCSPDGQIRAVPDHVMRSPR